MKHTLFILLTFFLGCSHAVHGVITCDILIYGGTSAGVVAAVQAKHLGKSVILINPGKHVGGATSNGIGWVDQLHHHLVGGITKEFFQHVWRYYQTDAAWKYEPKHLMRNQRGYPNPNDHTMWILEPHIGERIFKSMLKTASVQVVCNEKLNRINGVQKNGQQILQIQTESGNSYQAQMFIDATYEGDLMAAAGVSYTVGRESNQLYGETHNGIHLNLSFNSIPIDPYKIKGDPASGLLPRIYPNLEGNPGDADHGVQAYNYRVCLTNVPENRVVIEKPSHYDESQYEILFRAAEAGVQKFFQFNFLPNLKIDANTLGPVSTDYVGMSWGWAEADDVTRKQIALQHENWHRGLLWSLQNHPRIPSKIRQYYASWGLAKDEFIENNHWPYELYVREARRMVSSMVITENHALGTDPITDGVGLASYPMDSHRVKYYVSPNGLLHSEGSLFLKIPISFPVSYQALVPKKEECRNLIVPVCLSATHVAYGAIRTEPTYMILGQSAATAASLAIDLGVDVQDVPYEKLKAQLLQDGQICEDHQ